MWVNSVEIDRNEEIHSRRNRPTYNVEIEAEVELKVKVMWIKGECSPEASNGCHCSSAIVPPTLRILSSPWTSPGQ